MSSAVFNVLDWYENDEIDPEEGKKRIKKYVIRIFGRTEDDQSVALKIENFTPFFFVEVPSEWDDQTIRLFKECVKVLCEKLDTGQRSWNGGTFDKNPKYNSRHLISHDVLMKYKFYGFHANTKFKYVRFIFNNLSAMKRFARLFDSKIEFMGSHTMYRIYESNIDPYLRFMHIRDIDACGWVEVKDYDDNDEEATTDINIKCAWTAVSPVKDKIGIAPFKIASFDIECTSADGSFPQAHRLGDRIIQIGTSFSRYGSSEVYKKHIITLNSCEAIEGIEVVQCRSERDVLLEWQKLIEAEDPDILTGYNIFYFDEKYMYDRSMLTSIDCTEDFTKLSKILNLKCEFRESRLSSSALGDNILRFFKTPGRVQIDLMKVVQKDFKLNSYKLDAVAEYFIKEPITSLVVEDGGVFVITTKNTSAVKVGNFIKIEENGESIEEKLKVLDITGSVIRAKPEIDFEVDATAKLYWGLVKDDVSPNDIFRLQKGTAADRKLIAQYCVQDCVLVSKLMAKLDILVNNISMANVCHVPMTYLFVRGQGIKSLSLVSKECRRKNFLIPVIKKKQSEEGEEDVGYEGATVFEPEIGYHRIPVVVKDYNSLYPSSIIAYNMSHETIVLDPNFHDLEDYTYMSISFNNSDGSKTTCRYARHTNGELGILPAILDKLIKERKSTRKQMEAEVDPFKRTILDGKQLALKVTANSLYGQLGAATSPICMKELAASTTAVGRLMLETARDFVQGGCNQASPSRFVEILQEVHKCTGSNTDALDALLDQELEDRNNTKFIEFMRSTVQDIFDKHAVSPRVIYGDTDSIFIKMNIIDRESGEVQNDRRALDWSIKLGQISSKLLKKRLPPPENMEYEKTFWPFAIMAKKKYVGNKYEDNPNKFKQASMGIVLKRRDNANIVKKIIGGIIDIMMNKMDIEMTKEYVLTCIKDMLAGRYPIKDFITTKTLKGSYKVKEGQVNVTAALMDAKEVEGGLPADMSAAEKQKVIDNHAKQKEMLEQVSMTHVRLAKRMAERDPGNKPMINERIPFVKVERFAPRGVKLLQGDMVEHPDYIKQHNLQIDYLFYLTNQIVNPAVQILDLIIPDSKEHVFGKVISEHTARRKEREAHELQVMEDNKTKKSMNDFVKKYNWVKYESDEDEMDSWMPIKDDITQMINELKGSGTKKGRKTTKKTIIV
jgi:DNA polymerase elongation subunit (family B)